MFRHALSYFLLLFVILAGALAVDAQRSITGRSAEEEEMMEKSVKEMLSKQQAAHDKKEHEELLKRGDEILEISMQLEKSLERSDSFTEADRRRLVTLEKLVKKVRDDLGGDDDYTEDPELLAAKNGSSVKDAMKYLLSTSNKLVGELKKTTRFSISVVAIQSSNAVLRLSRLLRLRN